MKKIVLIGLAAVVAVGIAVPMALGASAPKATGNVDFVYPNVTGNVTFEAQGTTTNAKGKLAYTNSTGGYLNGVVTCYIKVDNTAMFSGPITSGSPGYTGTYFVAKVVDDVWAAGRTRSRFMRTSRGACSEAFGADHANVTSGNLAVHKA